MQLPIEMRLFLAEQYAATHKRLVAAAKADPAKHKTTLVWPEDGRLSWRYFEGGIDKRGKRRRFCWTTTRNAAGYFLSFVEVYDTKKGIGERIKFVASRNRTRMKERARTLYRTFANRKRGAGA